MGSPIEHAQKQIVSFAINILKQIILPEKMLLAAKRKKWARLLSACSGLR